MIVIQQHKQQNACMASITIRDVPDDVRAELAARAARSHQSMQEYLKAALTDLTVRPERDEVLARIAHRVDRTGSSVSVDAILEAKDADRR